MIGEHLQSHQNETFETAQMPYWSHRTQKEIFKRLLSFILSFFAKADFAEMTFYSLLSNKYICWRERVSFWKREDD